ncbi:MAG: 30S ribosomal protein S20 [Candidatus Buchananbacteria bacterium]|nr:30S ribosomal protein S20 [Candidatus Buchananbacteria bacterium]
MPQTKQAKKELRKSQEKADYNLKIKQDLKTLIKKTRKAIENKEGKVEEMLKQVQKSIDKAVQKGVIKKNTGGRKLSRLLSAYKKSQQAEKEKPEEKNK